MPQSSNDVLLIAIVPKALKDNLVDALMMTEHLTGFSLFKIQGFSKAHSHYNVSEQVEGYRDFYRFELLHNSDNSVALKELIGTMSVEQNIRYWILPLLEAGSL